MVEKVRERLDDDAVSPVIGVILMVAITVILAAVIGTFVLGLGSQVQENAQAGATVDFEAGDPGSVTVTYVSSQNADKIIVNETTSNTTQSTSNTDTLSSVGSSVTLDESGTTSKDHEVHVVVTAVKGETKTVILDQRGTI